MLSPCGAVVNYVGKIPIQGGKVFRWWVTVMLALVTLSLANAAWAEWRVSSGVYVSGGDYGHDQDTRIRILSQGLQWRSRDYSLKLAVPWLSINGPGDLTLTGDRSGGDPVSGLGDVSLEGTRSFGINGWLLETGLKWKFPTADETEGLGTGQDDQQWTLAAARNIGRWTAFGGIGWLHRGKVPGEAFRDSRQGHLGVQAPLGTGWSAGVYGEWRDAAREHREPLREAALFATWRADSRWRLSLTALRGFSPSGPEWLAGSQIGWIF